MLKPLFPANKPVQVKCGQFPKIIFLVGILYKIIQSFISIPMISPKNHKEVLNSDFKSGLYIWGISDPSQCFVLLQLQRRNGAIQFKRLEWEGEFFQPSSIFQLQPKYCWGFLPHVHFEHRLWVLNSACLASECVKHFGDRYCVENNSTAHSVKFYRSAI